MLGIELGTRDVLGDALGDALGAIVGEALSIYEGPALGCALGELEGDRVRRLIINGSASLNSNSEASKMIFPS